MLFSSYDTTIFDHLAEYFHYLAAAPSFWFSLNSSYDHEFHLSRRLGMSPDDYECIMVAAKHINNCQSDEIPTGANNTIVVLTGKNGGNSNRGVSNTTTADGTTTAVAATIITATTPATTTSSAHA
jgi:hypothetical protein